MRQSIILMLVLLIVNASLVQASPETTVNFNIPEKFTDFKTTANLRLNDREMLMDQLTKLIKESTNKILNKGNYLEITINNIDMAGMFLYSNSDLVRIVKDSDRVRLEFAYRLFDASGSLIKQDDANLTSRNLNLLKSQYRKAKQYKHTHFTHEMPLFDDWLLQIVKEIK